jgi:hypothetical protein
MTTTITEEALIDASRRFRESVRALPVIDADAAIRRTIFADAEPFDPARFVEDVIAS